MSRRNQRTINLNKKHKVELIPADGLSLYDEDRAMREWAFNGRYLLAESGSLGGALGILELTEYPGNAAPSGFDHTSVWVEDRGSDGGVAAFLLTQPYTLSDAERIAFERYATKMGCEVRFGEESFGWHHPKVTPVRFLMAQDHPLIVKAQAALATKPIDWLSVARNFVRKEAAA